MQRSIGMVEIAWGTISLYWVCSLTYFGHCRFSNIGKESFNITSICTNLWRFRLDIDNLEMQINIYKNWLNDAHVVALESMGQFMKMEAVLMEENNDLIKKVGLLKMERGWF